VSADLQDLLAVLAELREEAERLETENADLRRWLTSLLFWAIGTEDLLAVARELVERRFPRRELSDDEALALRVADERRAA
jgi:hypothetical protein